MAKKSKVKKTLVDQILDKAKIDHDSLPLKGIRQDQSLVLSLSLSIYPKRN